MNIVRISFVSVVLYISVIAFGCAPSSDRFIDHNNGTITDSKTGLMWAKNANIAGRTMVWTEAYKYCSQLDHAGYNDWRLPSLKELRSLLDRRNTDPALPSPHPFTGVQTGYWSSSTHRLDSAWHVGGSVVNAWGVNMNWGGHGHYGTMTASHVWPVRAGQSPNNH